jgi:hypothetical protein
MRPLILGLVISGWLAGFDSEESRCRASSENASSATGPAIEQPAGMCFSKTLERRLQTTFFSNEDRLLNLKSGQVQSIPARIPMNGLNNPRPLFNWMAKEAADLLISNQNSRELRLHLDDGLLAVLPSHIHFDSILPAELDSSLLVNGSAQVVNIPKPEDVPGPVLAFRTREGGRGVLQVLICRAEPDSHVRVRYKLLLESPRRP